MSSNKGRDCPDDDFDRDHHSSKRARTSRIDEMSSDCSQRRSYSTTGIIDEKASRNGQIENGSYYVAPKAPSDAGSDSKKRSRSFVRPIIRSAVPNSQLTSIAKRPSQPGHVGDRIELYSNHFKIDFSKRSNEVILYQFDVDVEILMRDGSWRSCKKDERLQVMKTIFEREHFPLVWYDEGKNLYSIENLTLNLKKEYQCEIIHKKTERTNKFRFLLINLVKTYELKTIFDFMEKRISVRPHDPVRILETLFKQTQRSDMVTIKNQSYPKHQRLDDLGDGRGLASGFYQAIVLGERGPTLNINNTFCCFYQNYNLVEFLSCYMGHDIRKSGIPLKDHPLIVRKVLKSLWFVTSHTNQVRRYRLKSFGRPANEHKFVKDQGEQITVADYFDDKWKIRLRHPHLPVVELYNPADKSKSHHLPMELVTVDEWQRSLKPLTTDQRARVTKKTVVRPGERYGMIRRVADERQFNKDSYLEKFGINVDINEMLLVPARILPSPEIKYKSSRGDQGDVVERVQIGKWWLNNRFNKAREIRTWAVVLVSQREPDNRQIRLASDFASKIPQAMSKYGIQFKSPAIEKSDAAVPQTILARMNELKIQGCEVIIYILNQVGDDIYHAIKYFGNVKLGIVTQCTRFDRLMSNSDPRKMDMYIQNLVQKFNAKLGGVNQLVSLMRALTSPSARSDVFMFFGIDCTHITCSRERPSIAAIIGSKDSTSTQYAGRVVQQFSPKGKIALEIIKDLHILVGELLREFSNHNSRLPNKLVFYRAGVDDGSFQKVLDNELRAIQRACQELYGHNQLPQICFVIVKRRHNTRFFAWDKQSNQTNNIQPGTVIDTDIVSPNGFDFYLNSHAAIQGTSRPVLYQVLYDEIGFTSDEIQQLTNYLCHTDVRCTKAVSVPAPVHYATLCVSRGLNLDYEGQMANEQRSIAASDLDEALLDENVVVTLDDVLTTKIDFNPSIENTMWFA
jgi:eukaryotic translation initiation factor 2C